MQHMNTWYYVSFFLYFIGGFAAYTEALNEGKMGNLARYVMFFLWPLMYTILFIKIMYEFIRYLYSRMWNRFTNRKKTTS